jgi:cell division protein FtsL
MYAVGRPVENVYLVRERDRRRSRELLTFALAALPPMAVLFGAIWANLETVRLGYQHERLERQHEQLLEKNRSLATARAQVAALARVDAIARGSLGLGTPRPGQLAVIKDGVEQARVPAPATSATPAPTAAPSPSSGASETPATTEEGF